MQSHKNVLHYIRVYTNNLHINADDRLTLLSSYGFDAAIMDIFGALLNGATLFPIDIKEDGLINLASALNNNGITIYHSTPTVYRYFIRELSDDQFFPSIRLVVLGGEAVHKKDLNSFRSHFASECIFVNGFGPTESTVSLQFLANKQTSIQRNAIPIGYPVEDTDIILLTHDGKPAALYGEIGIRSSYVALGYWRLPELSKAVFLIDPIDKDKRIYRTGDLGRLLPDGSIEFLGRKDYQVKIRGYRVEVSEVESRLMEHSALKDAVVLAVTDAGEEKHLVAYFVRKLPSFVSTIELRNFLESRLPDYMIPSIFVELDVVPLTPNGKVDLRSLPQPNLVDFDFERKYITPKGQIEEILIEIWRIVLKLDRVGIQDNFFELGGHSLLATQIVSRLRDYLQIELPLRVIFKSPTVYGIARHIEDAIRDKQVSDLPPIKPIVPKPIHPALSFSQERMWIVNKLSPKSVAYNLPVALRIKGNLDIDIFGKCLEEIIRRHESLRTTIKMTDGRPYQSIAPPVSLELPIIDLGHLSPEVRDAGLIEALIKLIREPFDLELGPLYKLVLFHLDEHEFVLFLSIHHAVADQWSFGVLGQELSSLYSAYRSGEPFPLSDLPIQYLDYAQWQREWLDGTILEEQLSYWRKQLEGMTVLELPTDKPRPVVQTNKGELQHRLIPSQVIHSLKNLGHQERATLYMVLLAGFNLLLSRYTGQKDITIGIPIANRTRLEIEPIIGTFVNTLVLRTDLSNAVSFRELLQEVRKVTLAAFAHQDIPFEKLVEELQPVRDTSRSPLFQVFCNIVNYPFQFPALDGLTIEPLSLKKGAAQFDLTLSFSFEPEPIVVLVYNTDLFEESTANGMLNHYLTLLESISIDPDKSLTDVQIIPETEQQQVLTVWNSTQTDFPKEMCVHKLFEQQVINYPSNIAVRFGDKADHLTYKELHERSDEVALYLQALGIGPNSVVGVYMYRSLDLVVSLLGVLKAGGAYLPLDPAFPTDRLRYMLSNSHAKVVLSNVDPERIENLRQGLPDSGLFFIDLTTSWQEIRLGSRVKRELSRNQSSSENLAYLIYTSGSTGYPKGVQITHKAVVNFLLSMQKEPGLSPDDRLLALTTISFDIHVLEIFLPLITGAQVVLASREAAYDGFKIQEILNSTKATVLQATPSSWQLLIEFGLARSTKFESVMWWRGTFQRFG